MIISKTTKIIEQKFIQMRETNVKNVQTNPHEAEEKIKNHVERWPNNCSIESILKKIKTDPEIATFFAKDPAKQNEAETLVSELIKQNPTINNFKVLPKAGIKSIRIGIDGNFIYGNKTQNNKTSNKIENATKSVDFYFEIDTDIYYCTQKFTRGAGGSQDNQCHDVINFLTYGSRNTSNDESRYFVAILDGDYFNSKKIDEINETFNTYTNVFATSADFFINDVENC